MSELLFGSERSERVTEVLDGMGYMRLLDLPAIPESNSMGLRYQKAFEVAPAGNPWYVRSYGLRFDLASPRWLRSSRKWYSLGWGLDPVGEQREILLVQEWGNPSDRLGLRSNTELMENLDGYAEAVEVTEAGYCLRAAALIDSPGDSAR
ncbi:hypothetical protein [Streptantibioticus ferralitis]|uniref:Uncharacterized protein n=1 Tax=Streptantibioticus ferralitis TaxID=236510 RepID=A0ABT5Z1M9_9ACTN|nr:hypothetical protein [Streptantibioticus ferralitis]MDF2257726.1 hypothetical protein [Streptantibioticus ferralitis]